MPNPCTDLEQSVCAHESAFRFFFWQRQLNLLPDASSTWPLIWSKFSDTYSTLASAHVTLDPSLMRAIRIDVARLSRYFDELSTAPCLGDDHVCRLERILYIFSASSSANGYRQGFHEILAPLYCVSIKGGPAFGLSPDASEAIAFFLLPALVNGTIVGDFFLSADVSFTLPHLLDISESVLKKFDKELAVTMESNGVAFVLFAFSWITVLFSQTYKLAQILRLWDFLFADIDCMEQNLAFLITAHLVNLRDRLIGKDFVRIMNEFRGLELDSEADAIRTAQKIVRAHRL
jgi:hypothetical protein